jgi:pyridoxal phosphate enzyme (YggS family)
VEDVGAADARRHGGASAGASAGAAPQGTGRAIRIDPVRVRRNLAELREEIGAAAARAGRDPTEVEVLAATKYVALADLPGLAQAGITLVGENRAQDLAAKAAAHGELFRWDFIGQLQSRRVRTIARYVRLIHSVGSASAMRAVERALGGEGAVHFAVLVQVNVAREPGKAGVLPEELDELIAGAGAPVQGLMTMPPASADPERSRRWFAALRELAARHGLARLSMGTSQDYLVAVEEGATIVRIGTRLYL